MKKTVYIRLDADVWDCLRHYAVDMEISKMEAVENAIVSFLDGTEWDVENENK